MPEHVETCSAADFRDKWGRVTPKSLMNGDNKTKTFADGGFVRICWSADQGDYVVSTPNSALHYGSIRSARAAYSLLVREALAKQHKVECDATL